MKSIHYRNDQEPILSLIQKHPILQTLFESPDEIHFELETNYFVALTSAIVSQQLSGKVATVIYNRLTTLLKQEITPENFLRQSFDDLRGCGLSGQKIRYLTSLAELVESGEVHFRGIEDMTDQEIIEMLTKIKGIGVWTAEMFLMFSMGREDVFSVLDLGLRSGLQKLYGKEMSKEEMVDIAMNWSPNRSVVSFYLWRYNERVK
ncbi:MAG: DNA-3-methyladenine glycosylase [Candidatus Izemoplasmatales bacterium]